MTGYKAVGMHCYRVKKEMESNKRLMKIYMKLKQDCL